MYLKKIIASEIKLDLDFQKKNLHFSRGSIARASKIPSVEVLHDKQMRYVNLCLASKATAAEMMSLDLAIFTKFPANINLQNRSQMGEPANNRCYK